MPKWREKATLIQETMSVWSIKDKMRRGCATGNRGVVEMENVLAELLTLNNPDVHGQAISLFIFLTRHSQHNRGFKMVMGRLAMKDIPILQKKIVFVRFGLRAAVRNNSENTSKDRRLGIRKEKTVFFLLS
jgi:hypothetical protein